METDLEQLKRQVEALARTTEDTNRAVHKMRGAQRRQVLLRVLWWVAILAVGAYSYLTYVQPYVAQTMAAYGNAKDFQLQVQDFFAQFGQTKTQ